ncbi:Hemolysin transporter protein ShlB [Moritella yayanosii]|uniref:Hemolysin transporter protein ShlB n=2 Tax=Moritella yayanosii TaxID=69539 RepID=A0A330LJA1_9GAMM|nr:Hemolysin transporter protein ShlB [Moritella yayanosii]
MPLLFVFSIIISVQAYSAQTNVLNTLSPVNEARQALQTNQRNIEQLIEQGRYQQLNSRKLQARDETKPLLPDTTQCLPINNVYLQGITLFTSQDLGGLTALPKHCITSTQLNVLVREITLLYVSRGYITTRVKFIPPDQQARLGLQIIEGFVEGIDDPSQRLNLTQLFPGVIEQPLNLRDLEQGLDQANRLQSNQVQLDITPGSKLGGSWIKLHNDSAKPWQLSASMDNYGQESTGKWITRVGATLDNPFNLSDFVNVSVSSSLTEYGERYNRSYSLLYSVPFGYFTVNGFVSFSEYLNNQQLKIHRVALHGKTQQTGIKADYVFYRDQDQLDSIFTQLSYKQVDNYFETVRLDISSPTLTVAEVGVSHMQILPAGQLNLNVSVEQGLPWFGADNSRDKFSASDTEPEFVKGKLWVNFNQYFSLFDRNYLYNALWYTQYSPDYLPGVEWLSISDSAAVRGFSNTSLSSDGGWYLRNTISHRFLGLGGIFTAHISADVGHLYAQQTAIGLSTGLNYSYQWLSIGLDASRGLVLSADDFPEENVQLLGRISVVF